MEVRLTLMEVSEDHLIPWEIHDPSSGVSFDQL